MTPTKFPLTLQAVRVEQPIGEFFLTSLRADLLSEVAFSDTVQFRKKASGYEPEGTERNEGISRLKDIGRFIDTSEATFPASLIIAANYSADGLLDTEDPRRWTVTAHGEHLGYEIQIPSNAQVASIVDGQHRLHGFKYSVDAERAGMQLPCSVFFDAPNPYQAYLFATVNFNQKKVDRSLAYELFGFDLDEEDPQSWSPDKLGVFLSRKLNVDPESAFCGRIRLAAAVADDSPAPPASGRKVSTATVVEGILRLIATNPGKDRDELGRRPKGKRQRALLAIDESPLRQLYLEANDRILYDMVATFFRVVDDQLWKNASETSYITRTVGVQALFDVLRELSPLAVKARDVRPSFFKKYLNVVAQIDFANDFFQASGKGRGRIRNVTLLAMELRTKDELPEGDQDTYGTLVSSARRKAKSAAVG